MRRILYILIISLFVFGCASKKDVPEFSPIQVTYHDTISYQGGWHTGDAVRDEPELIPEYLLDEDGDGIPDDIDEYPLETVEELVGEVIEEYYIEDEKLLLKSELPSQYNGTLVYKVDSVLIIGVASRVEARIIKQVSQETTSHLVSLTTHTSTGVIYEEVIWVGDIMDMELKSLDKEAIIVNEITVDDQLVDENDVTYWLWSVTAKKIGNYGLIMTARIKEEGPSRDVIIFDKSISVVNKPKKKYSVVFSNPDNFKRYDDNIFKLDIIENKADAYNFEWGGEGEVVLEVDGKVNIVFEGGTINNNKEHFQYTWWITPEGKEKVLPFTLKIIGDYEDVIILEHEFIVKKNPKESFNRFVDNAVKRWYWIFTALLIPVFGYIRKKYFKKKD